MLIVHHGQFGAAVARRLDPDAACSRPLGEVLRAPDPADDPTPTLLVSGVPAYDLFRRFARRMETARAVWTLGYVNGSHLYCGPTFGPAPGPCFDCFFKRALSHLGSLVQAEQEIAQGQFYSADLQRDHPGFAATSVEMMAQACRDALTRPKPGRLVRVDLLDVDVTPSRITPVHGCPHCRGPKAVGARFTRHLKHQLEWR